MKLPIYIISDNHFLLDRDKLEEERRAKLFKLFQKIKNTGGTLILGGDFFDFWIEFKFGYPTCYEDILNELEILHNNNIEIHYVKAGETLSTIANHYHLSSKDLLRMNPSLRTQHVLNVGAAITIYL